MSSRTPQTSHPSLSGVNPTDKRIEISRMLYPLFKEEVYKRREQMIRLTTLASTFLVAVLITLLATARWAAPAPPTQWLVISGIAIFFGIFAYVILQHAERHRMAKQQLIELEQQLGLYQDGSQPNGQAFFPKNWQSDWKADRSPTIYLSVLATLTVLAICTILARG